MRYRILDAGHSNRIFLLTRPLRKMKECAYTALDVARRDKILTVKKFVDEIDFQQISGIRAFKARVADFPLVFPPAFAIPLLMNLVDEMNDEVLAIHRDTPYTEVNAAYREWFAISHGH